MARRTSRRTTSTKATETKVEAKVEEKVETKAKKLPKAVKPLNGRKFTFAEIKNVGIKLTEINLDDVFVDGEDVVIPQAQISLFDGELNTEGKVIIRKAEIGRKNWEFNEDKEEAQKAYSLQQNLWYSTHPSGAKKQYIEVFDSKGTLLADTKNEKPGVKTAHIHAKNPIMEKAKK